MIRQQVFCSTIFISVTYDSPTGLNATRFGLYKVEIGWFIIFFFALYHQVQTMSAEKSSKLHVILTTIQILIGMGTIGKFLL